MAIISLLLQGGVAFSQTSMESSTEVGLQNLSAFKMPHANWNIVGKVIFGMDEKQMKVEKGNGILFHPAKQNNQDNLLTTKYFGDLELEFDFLLSAHSHLNVYLQGRYGIDLWDSWSKENAKAGTSGGIYQGGTSVPSFRSPGVSVCRAPGLWQHVQIYFQAPKFTGGKKITDAKFVKVVYNDMVIHQDIILPTQNSFQGIFKDESATGPILFTTSNNIGIRNIRVSPFGSDKDMAMASVPKRRRPAPRPILLNPTNETIVQRCFIKYNGEKRTFCASVGDPSGIHYALDMSQAEILNVWKGGFIDATTMWDDRGVIQLAEPTGSKIEMDAKPTFALLNNLEKEWPDSIDHSQNFSFKGYSLNEKGQPLFKYVFNGTLIEDNIVPENEQFLTRTLLANTGEQTDKLWFLLGHGQQIEQIGRDLFSINNGQFYIKIHPGESRNVHTRKGKNGDELIAQAVPAQNKLRLVYSIIW